MIVRFEIHPSLRRYVHGAEVINVDAETLGEALTALADVSDFTPVMFAWLKGRHPSIAVFRNKDLIRGRYGRRPLKERDVIRLYPTM